jgi:hypothetical protein
MGATKAQQKQKKTAAAATLAAHRNRKGRPPKTHLSPTEEAYCFHRACGDTIRKAAALCGLNEGTCLQWSTRRPAIAKRVEELRVELKEEIVTRLAENRILTVEWLDAQYIRLLKGVKKLDSTATLAILNGWKSTGTIATHAPIRPTGRGDAREHPDLPPSTGPNLIDVYEAKWLRDKKALWNKQLEETHASK